MSTTFDTTAVGRDPLRPPQSELSRRLRFFGYGFAGLVLTVDQLLLPMFHVGNVPYKVSYILLGVALLSWLAAESTDRAARGNRELFTFALAIGAIIVAGLLGELWLAANEMVISHSEASRSVLIYLLLILAFGLGQRAGKFRMGWLPWIFVIAASLNLAFGLLRSQLPGWLVSVYYAQRNVADLGVEDVRTVQDLLEMARPRGLFGNPNTSALMVNVIVLFIQIGLRNDLLRIRSILLSLAILFLPLIVAGLLASRGEFIVATILALLNLRWIAKRMPPRRRMRFVFTAVAVPVLAAVMVVTYFHDHPLLKNLGRVVAIVNTLSDSTRRASRDEGVARPLLALDIAVERVSAFPLTGTGFGMAVDPPFDYGTQYYHNDWLRLLATSGVVGVLAMLFVIRRFSWRLGWPIVLPFLLPGLINTFMLTPPAFVFYWFMVGVVRAKLRDERNVAGTRGPLSAQ
jgi:hypothetical protein